MDILLGFIKLSSPDPWILLVVFWIPLIYIFYVKFWKSTVDKLKGASKKEGVEIIKTVGFKKYILIHGIFYGNILAITSTLISIFGHKITLAKFIDTYVANSAAGLVVGIILWFIATRKVKEKEKESEH